MELKIIMFFVVVVLIFEKGTKEKTRVREICVWGKERTTIQKISNTTKETQRGARFFVKRFQ